MTEDEAIAKLDALGSADIEVTYIDADDVLVAFLRANGFERVAQAYEEVQKRCNGFWYA